MENKQEVESPAPLAWRPEVGKTAWCRVMPPGEIHELQIHEDCSYKYHLRSKEEHCYSVSKVGQPKFELWSNHLFPTAEAALKSIKIYDLAGREVEIMAYLPYGVGNNNGFYGTFGAPLDKMRLEPNEGSEGDGC